MKTPDVLLAHSLVGLVVAAFMGLNSQFSGYNHTIKICAASSTDPKNEPDTKIQHRCILFVSKIFGDHSLGYFTRCA